MSWITENIGNIIVIALLCAVIFLIIRSMIKNKKSGRSSCGCGCADCAMKDKCHPEKSE